MTPKQLKSLRQHIDSLSAIRDVIKSRNEHTKGYIESGPVDILKSEITHLREIAPSLVIPDFDYIGQGGVVRRDGELYGTHFVMSIVWNG